MNGRIRKGSALLMHSSFISWNANKLGRMIMNLRAGCSVTLIPLAKFSPRERKHHAVKNDRFFLRVRFQHDYRSRNRVRERERNNECQTVFSVIE